MTRASLVTLALAVLAAARGGPAAAQPVNKEMLELQRRDRQSRYTAIEQNVADKPVLKAGRIEDVFRFTARDGRLTFEAPSLPPPDEKNRYEEFQVRAAGFPGPTFVQVFRTAAPRAVPVPPKAAGPNPPAVAAAFARTFTFTALEQPDPETLVTYTVQASAAYLRLERRVESDRGYATVMLRQDTARSPDGQEVAAPVNLYVTRAGAAAGPRSISAASFAALCQDHPAEVEADLRPLLSRLGQEHLFAPDPRVAWQVLNAYWPTDPVAARAVGAVLPRLLEPDFATREAAVRDLIALGRPGAAAMLRLDRRALTPEQSVLVGRALAGYHRLPEARAERLRSDRTFLVDCLLSDDADVRRAGLAQLKVVVGGTVDVAFDPDAPTPD
ncbi:MAG TPA: hypothetical protein VF796_04925, partial [Humisphaera sp.]